MGQLLLMKTYGKYNTSQKNRECISIEIKNTKIFFSHNNPIAFSHPDIGLCVMKNENGNVIEKHFSWIDGGTKEAIKNRKSKNVFLKKYNDILKSLLN